jgi:hypothetical protein
LVFAALELTVDAAGFLSSITSVLVDNGCHAAFGPAGLDAQTPCG